MLSSLLLYLDTYSASSGTRTVLHLLQDAFTSSLGSVDGGESVITCQQHPRTGEKGLFSVQMCVQLLCVLISCWPISSLVAYAGLPFWDGQRPHIVIYKRDVWHETVWAGQWKSDCGVKPSLRSTCICCNVDVCFSRFSCPVCCSIWSSSSAPKTLWTDSWFWNCWLVWFCPKLRPQLMALWLLRSTH